MGVKQAMRDFGGKRKYIGRIDTQSGAERTALGVDSKLAHDEDEPTNPTISLYWTRSG